MFRVNPILVDELLHQVRRLKLTAADISPLVRDLTALNDEADRVSMGGEEEQVRFLKDRLGSGTVFVLLNGLARAKGG